MEEYISADPIKFDHSTMFKTLQTLTLDFRLNDPFCSLVRLVVRISRRMHNLHAV